MTSILINKIIIIIKSVWHLTLIKLLHVKLVTFVDNFLNCIKTEKIWRLACHLITVDV